MVELRRERTDAIAFVDSEGERTELSTRQRDVFWGGLNFASQRAIQVAPDGSTLAFVDLGSGVLHVRDKQRTLYSVPIAIGGDVRYSPDTRWIAAQVAQSRKRPLGQRAAGVVIVDATTGQTQRHVAMTRVRWLEWIADGLVVLHKDGKRDALTLVGHDGSFRRLVTSRTTIRRFAASPLANTIAWFADPTLRNKRRRPAKLVVRLMDVSEPELKPRVVGETKGFRNNAEIAPDGSTLAWAAADGVYLAENGGLRLLEKGKGMHSVWFSRDGALAWANRNHIGYFRDGTVTKHISRRPIRTMRLRRDKPGVVFVVSHKLHTWSPGDRDSKRVGQPASGHKLVSGDLFAGGVVLWQTKTVHSRRRPWRKSRPWGKMKQVNAKQRLLL